MKKELKGFVLGMVLTASLLISMPVFADGVLKTIKVTFNSISVIVNGKTSTADNFMYQGRTFVNLRDLCNLLDKEFSYDPAKQTIVVNDKPPVIPPNKPVPNDNKPVVTVDETKPTPVMSDDKTKPAITGNVSTLSGNSVEITFSEKLDKTSAENTANYSIIPKYGVKTPLQVSRAVLDSSGTKVVLTTAGQQMATLYNIEVSNIKDPAGNVIDTDTKTFVGMKSNNPAATDSNPFTVTSVSAVSGMVIEVIFSHKMEQAAAQNTACYKINAKYGAKEVLQVTGAVLDSSSTKVTLTVSGMKEATLYELKATNITDIYGNTVSGNSTAFVGKN